MSGLAHFPNSTHNRHYELPDAIRQHQLPIIKCQTMGTHEGECNEQKRRDHGDERELEQHSRVYSEA